MEQETKIATFIQKETMLATLQTQEHVELAMLQNKKAKAMVDWAESMRIEATKPILDAKRKLDLLWKTRTAPLLALIDHNKKNLESYMFAQEAITAKELKDFDFNKKEATNLAKIEIKSTTGVSYRVDWEITVLDMEKVPAKYIIKSVDEKLIKESLKEGKKSIPGLNIKEKKIIITK